MRGKAIHTATSAVLLCGLLLTAGARPAGAHEPNQTEKCAAKMFLTVNGMSRCLVKAQVMEYVTGDCEGWSDVFEACVSTTAEKLQRIRDKSEPACGINGLDDDAIISLVGEVAVATVIRYRAVTGLIPECDF